VILAAIGPAAPYARPADELDGVAVVPSADGLPISAGVHGAGELALVFIHGCSCDRTY